MKATKNTTGGMILVDIMIAFSLATLMITVMTQSSLGAREIFYHGKERNRLLDIVVAGTSTEIRHITTLYGNEMIEDNISLENISFTSVRGIAPPDSYEFSGTPLCSVDFMDKNVVGFDSKISITPITLPINPLLPLTDIEVRNNIAYISTDSNIASDPDIFVMDIRNKDNVAVLSSMNTGPGISSFTIVGKRIFAAAASTASQLHIIRLDGLNSMVLEKKYRLPLPYATATPPFASGIFYDRGLVYLGTEKWDSDELSIIDVNDPLSPIVVGGFETSSKINDIFVYHNIAYIADSDMEQLRVIDVTDTSNPSIVNSYSPSGWNRQEGKILSLFEGGLSLGRTSGGFDIPADHELFHFDIVATTYAMSPSASVNIPGGVYGIVADRSRLYLATRELNKEFRIIDHNMNASSSAYFQLPVSPQTITCDNDKLYILAHSAPVIYEISFK